MEPLRSEVTSTTSLKNPAFRMRCLITSMSKVAASPDYNETSLHEAGQADSTEGGTQEVLPPEELADL